MKKIIGAMLLCGVFLWGLNGVARADPPTTNLITTIASNDPTKPSINLKNSSDEPCQVATTARGTVAITQVIQNHKAIQPLSLESSGEEDIGYLLQSQLKTLQPGDSVDIPLTVYEIGSENLLQATTWSLDGGAFTNEYTIAKQGALELDLNYSLPISPASGPAACMATFASNVNKPNSWQLWVMIGVGVVLAVVILFLIWWFWRKRSHKKGKVMTAALLIAAVSIAGYDVPSVFASVTVPPELQATYDGCISVFNANRDITGPVLDALNDPANSYTIVHTRGVGSDMTGMRNPSGTGGIFRIYWNPDDTHRYAGTGGTPDACSTLFHELYHAYDQLNGTFSRDDCAGSGIETKEVMATRAQNRLRERLGLPVRSHYGDRPLPSGDCRAPAPRDTCTGTHCGDSNGDPHLRTFDGLRYDFQAAGEFVVARSGDGVFEVQARQEPWANSRLVSINTAVAMKVGQDKVEVQSGTAMKLIVNGKPQDLTAHDLSDGAKIEADKTLVGVTWSDGSIAYIRPVGSYGIALSLQASDTLGGKLEGLLGDADGESKNDLKKRGQGKVVEEKHEQLYPAFADSWRIDDKSSLFTYGNGKNTAAYTISNFPDKPEDPTKLSGYAAAEVFCKNLGVSDLEVLANCALDMAITGRAEFARAALRSQRFATGTNTGTTWQVDSNNPKTVMTFDAKAGEKVFIDIPKTNLQSQCGTLKLLGPDGQEVASGCIINGTGMIDGVTLPTTGTYTVSLKPSGTPGTASIRLLRISDKQGNVTPDGDPVMITIDQPGVVARYTFNGQSGQRVYLDIPSSTLDSQCGVVRVLGPDNNEVGSGCIINRRGYADTFILPQTGQYTIMIDPNYTVIGQLQLKVILPTAENKPISIDGPAQTVKLTKPGSIATLPFNGAVGQRIFIDIPTSTLPSQCGLLTLRAPDGTSIGSGCVINGKGNLNDDGVVLPATGQYSIILDPNAADVGTSTIRIR